MRIGDEVTLLPPYDRDPIILAMQHYAHVAWIGNDGQVEIELTDTWPPHERFGPFPPARLAQGWRDENGRWR